MRTIMLMAQFLIMMSSSALGKESTDARSETLIAPSDWPVRYTAGQIAALRKTGHCFSSEDRELAKRLSMRRFSAQKIVVAYQDVYRLGLHSIQNIEAAVVLRALEVPISSLRDFVESKRSITDFYNQETHGGRGLFNAGIALTVVGLVSSIAGTAILVVTANRRSYDSYSEDSSIYGDNSMGWDHFAQGVSQILKYIIGGTLLGTGVVQLGAGISLTAVGSKKMSRWAKGDLLTTGTAQELQMHAYHHALRSKASRRPKVSLFPMVTGKGAGAGLTIQF